MLLVKTVIRPSKIEGIGLFANQFIPKGTEIWRFEPGFDLKISAGEFKKLPSIAQKYILRHGFHNPKTNNYILGSDNDRFFNHSEVPNVIEVDSESEENTDIAARDIQKGEELTCDYRTFDADFNYKMLH